MNDLKKNINKSKIEKNSIAEKPGKEKNGKDKNGKDKNGKDKTGHGRKDNSVNVLQSDRSDTRSPRRHWLRFAGCMLITAVIVAAGIIVPDRLLSVKRAMLYNNQVTVAADDIEPFGEAYNSTKNRLLSVIRFQNERDGHDIDVAYVDRDEKSNGIDGAALYQKGIDKLSKFFEKIDGVSFSEDNMYYVTVIKADNRDIYEMEIEMNGGSDERGDDVSIYDDMYAAADMYITSDVESGLPLTCTIFAQYRDLLELWRSVISAYQETLGIDWTDVTDYTANGYGDGDVRSSADGSISGSAASEDKGYDPGYDYGNEAGVTAGGYDGGVYYSFKAISTDGVFMLMGQIDGMGDGSYIFTFRLTERY